MLQPILTSLPLALKLPLPEMPVWSSSLPHGELLFTLHIQLKSLFSVQSVLTPYPAPRNLSLLSAAEQHCADLQR